MSYLKEQNCAADALGSLGHETDLGAHVLASPPGSLMNILSENAADCSKLQSIGLWPSFVPKTKTEKPRVGGFPVTEN